VTYDASDVDTQQNFNLTISDPGQAVWYIGIYGWSSCSYSITVFETATCPGGGNCNGHGACNADGSCSCSITWSGIACDQQMNSIFSGVIRSHEELRGVSAWKYYSFAVSKNSSSIVIALKETTGTGGQLWVFVALDSVPTIRNYLAASTDTNSRFHRISIDLETLPATDRVFQVGVYTNPYVIDAQSDIFYDIIAWAPDF